MPEVNSRIYGAVPVRLLLEKRATFRHLRVYAAISSFAGRGKCFASVKAIAARSRVSRGHVSRMAADLERWGYMYVQRRGRMLPNIYTLKCDSPESGDTLSPLQNQSKSTQDDAKLLRCNRESDSPESGALESPQWSDTKILRTNLMGLLKQTLVTWKNEQSIYGLIGQFKKHLGEEQLERILRSLVGRDKTFPDEHQLAAYLMKCQGPRIHQRLITKSEEGYL